MTVPDKPDCVALQRSTGAPKEPGWYYRHCPKHKRLGVKYWTGKLFRLSPDHNHVDDVEGICQCCDWHAGPLPEPAAPEVDNAESPLEPFIANFNSAADHHHQEAMETVFHRVVDHAVECEKKITELHRSLKDAMDTLHYTNRKYEKLFSEHVALVKLREAVEKLFENEKLLSEAGDWSRQWNNTFNALRACQEKAGLS